MTQVQGPRRLFLLVLASALLMQAAWILALPAFRGSDEFDHVYKAEAVAHGQLLDDGPAQSARGGLLTVPEDVVMAASRMCDSYDYTGRGNCFPIERVGGGMVTVASGASTYNPTYYAVVGLMARPFSGAGTDFAMRAFTGILAALLLAWAAVVTSGWARNGWPLAALLVTATPVLIYSTAVASPNGVGYAAACLLWAAGLGLVEDPARPRILALSIAALTVLSTHTTGVLWLTCVVLVIALLQPLSRWRALYRRSPGVYNIAVASIGLGGAACIAWILVAKTNALQVTDGGFGRLTIGELANGQLVWGLQTIAAFPLRNEPAPVIVYVLWLVPFVGLLVAGVRQATRRLRLTALVLLAVWVAVPAALTYLSYEAEGLAWQGRYALPLAIGFPALAGLALGRSGRGPRRPHVAMMVALCALAQTISCVRVAWHEADTDLSPAFAGIVPGGLVLIAALALAGGLLPLLVGRRPEPEVPTRTQVPARATVGA